jgi:uncharacterized paraquat-inducible protein A
MDSEKAAKLIRMLSSTNDGEVLNAARALQRMGVHDVAERIEEGEGFDFAAFIRNSVRRSEAPGSKAKAEIARLMARVEELESQLAKFGNRHCVVCGKPFVARRSDAATCSPRCRVRLHRNKRNRRSRETSA